MNARPAIRWGFDHRPGDWVFPAGETWITGWLETAADDVPVDVRLWIDERIFLGLVSLPFEPPQTAVPGRQRFAFLVEAGRGSRQLRIDAWSVKHGWEEFFETPIIGAMNSSSGTPALDWLERLPRFARALVRSGGADNAALADEVVRSALAQPLHSLPVPPFFGALETPLDDGYARDGKLLVSGWLAHQTRCIIKITARVSGGPAAALAHGLQRRDVGEQFPGLYGGDHSQFVGLVDLPRGLVEPALLLVFAEINDGSVRLVFARRFLPWERTPAAAGGPWCTDPHPLRSGWVLLRAVRRHGVPWWNLNRLFAAVRAPFALSRVVRAAGEGAFAESTPLSLLLSSFEDHEVRASPPQNPAGAVKADGLNLLFVLHCDFSCASALHVLALARELVRHGHTCIAAVPERLDTLADHEDPPCRGILHADAMNGVTFPNGGGPDVVHAWTTRESVRVVAGRVKQIHSNVRLVVHLEDNEKQILAATLQRSFADLARMSDALLDDLVTPDLSHPRRGARLLESADGVTVVVDTLAAAVPPGIPVALITPAADSRYFFHRPRHEATRRLVDPTGGTTVLFYNGNVHASNAGEMRELYAAVLQLNRTGSPTRLIRTGRSDQVDFLGSMAAEVAPFVSELGRIRRHRHLAPLMALADIFVQPGADNEFNACRLPSKLPEFFALGRPVILPRTNLGRITRHRVDAYVLEQADCAHLVEAVKTLRADRALYEALAAGALAFAGRHFNWERSAGELAEFYASIMMTPAEST